MSALPQGRRRDRYYGLGYVTDALLHLPFEGGKPYETDFSIDTNGHLGQKATVSGGVIGRPGKFGKAVQIAEATENLIVNPIFENNVTDGWSATANTNKTRITTDKYIGNACCEIEALTADTYRYINADAYNMGIGSDGHVFTVNFRIKAGRAADVGKEGRLYIVESGGEIVTNQNIAITLTADWSYVSNSYTVQYADNSLIIARFYVTWNSGDIGRKMLIDAVQLEEKSYPTPLCHGGMGNGHSWSGTAHNSTSVRTASVLSYPAAGNLNLTAGSISKWWKPSYANTTAQTSPYIFSEGNLKAYHLAADDKIYFTDGTNTISTAAQTFAANADIHLVFTWSSAGLKIYKNGVEAATGATYTAPAAGDNLYIGSDTSGANQGNSWHDDFTILDYALTADQVAQIYSNDAPLVVPGRYGLVDINTAQTVGGVKQFNDQMGIGGAPNANAILDLQSTSKPFMPPRMTTTQRDAVTSPAAGMVIFNTTTGVLNFYNGDTWGAV